MRRRQAWPGTSDHARAAEGASAKGAQRWDHKLGTVVHWRFDPSFPSHIEGDTRPPKPFSPRCFTLLWDAGKAKCAGKETPLFLRIKTCIEVGVS